MLRAKLLLTSTALAVVAVGAVVAPAARAAGNEDFVGTWSATTGGWVITSQDAAGNCTGTSDFSGYGFSNCHVSGSSYSFDVTCCGDYVSHNTGTFGTTTLQGSFTDTNGTTESYTGSRNNPPAVVAALTVPSPQPSGATFTATLTFTNSSATDETVTPGALQVTPASLATAAAASASSVVVPAGGSASVTYQVTGVQNGTATLAVDSTDPDDGGTPIGASASVVIGDPLTVTAVTLTQKDVATGDYVDVPSTGTIDGNTVVLTATVHNPADSPQTGQLLIGNPVDNSATTAATQDVTVPANADLKEVFTVDTSGLAWTDAGASAGQRTINVTARSGNPSSDNTTAESLTVRPKPVITVHGLNSDASTWSAYQLFVGSVNPLWRDYSVGDGQFPGTMDTSPTDATATTTNTIQNNAQQAATYIRNVQIATGAQHVDIVAHSMGGLISRQYIQSYMPASVDSRPVVDHLVMLGTPNGGSPCADELDGTLASYHNGAYVWPMHQLTTGYLAGFNATVTDRRGVDFSIAVGDSVPVTCGGTNSAGHLEIGDGVVPVSSALAITEPFKTYSVLHTAMTDSQLLFDDWVKPHLVVGPTDAGNTGVSATDSLTAAAAGTPAVRAAAAPALKLVRASVAPSVANVVATLHKGSTAQAITVPKGAKDLTVTVLAGAGVTSRLVAPSGHAASTVTAGSPAAESLFRSVTIAKPAAGTWHLKLSGSGFVAGTATIGSSPQSVTEAYTARTRQLRITVLSGTKVLAAHLTAKVEVAGAKKPTTLKLTLVRKGKAKGSYTTTLPKTVASGTAILVAAKAGGTTLTATRFLS